VRAGRQLICRFDYRTEFGLDSWLFGRSQGFVRLEPCAEGAGSERFNLLQRSFSWARPALLSCSRASADRESLGDSGTCLRLSPACAIGSAADPLGASSPMIVEQVECLRSSAVDIEEAYQVASGSI